MKYRVTNEKQRAQAVDAIESAEMPCVVDVIAGDDRSIAQNRTMWLWFNQIGKARGMTAEEVHKEEKAYVGVPILCRDSEKFAQTYDRCIRPLGYETKIEAMGLIDVTSIMTTGQMAEFLTGVKRRHPTVPLIDPDEPVALRAG